MGRSEVAMNDLNPDFTKSFKVDFIFETKQKYRVDVVSVTSNNDPDGTLIGSAVFELADILGSLHNMKILRVTDKNGNETGKCIVRLDKVEETNKKRVTIKMGAANIPKTSFFSNHNSFLKIYKLRLNDTILEKMKTEDVNYENFDINEWILIYKSRHQKGKEISYPPFEMSGSKLCNNNFDIPLKVELWKYKSDGSHKFLGQCFITLNEMVGRNWNKEFTSYKGKDPAELIIEDFKAVDSYEFIDFLRGGLNMTLIVGVDFTASNKDPEDPDSLHHINPPNLNLYQQAILAVGEILQKYNHTKQIPCYGFGARLPGESQTSHFFPLNMDYNDPCVTNFKDLFKIYHDNCQKIQFSGPTYFKHIFKEVNDFTKRRFELDTHNYSVFLLLTDGCVNDLQATIDQIVSGCYLPLTIIIIGIGEEDFSKMVVLDADDIPLVSSWGEQMKRDIVQFVPFLEFKNNPIVLREEVLDELPRQVRTFYEMKGIKPKEGKYIDQTQFNLSRGNTMEYDNRYADLLIQQDDNHFYPRID